MKKFLLLFLITSSIYSTEVKHSPWSLIIYRPENSYHINEKPCYLSFIDSKTNEEVSFTKIKANYSWIDKPKKAYSYKRSYYLYGGMIMHLNLKEGIYKIAIKNPEYNNDKTQNQFISNIFEYNTKNPTKVLFLIPEVNENGFYTEKWIISYKAPKYYKFTKGIFDKH